MDSVLVFIRKNQILVVTVLVILLALSIFNSDKSAEDTAKEFVEAMLKGDAKTVTNLTSEITIGESNYETKNLYTHAVEEILEATIQNYENKYGKNWKYKVKVIDSYDVDFSEIEDYVEITEFISSNMKEVAVSIEHKGRGWFNDKEGKEDVVITCIKQGRKWYVLYFE